MSLTLYDIETRRQLLYDMLGSDDPAEMQTAEDQLVALAECRDEKLQNCCGYLKNLRAESGAIQGEIERLKAARDKLQARILRFEAYMESCLEVGDAWSNGVHSVSYRKSQGVEISDLQAIPAQYMREKISYAPDKDLIAETIKCGGTVPGATLEVRHNLQVK